MEEKGAQKSLGAFCGIASMIGTIFVVYFLILIIAGSKGIELIKNFLIDIKIFGEWATYLGAIVAGIVVLRPNIDKSILPVKLQIYIANAVELCGQKVNKIHLSLTVINQRTSDVVLDALQAELISPSGVIYDFIWKQWIVTSGNTAIPASGSKVSPVVLRGREVQYKEIELESSRSLLIEQGSWQLRLFANVNVRKLSLVNSRFSISNSKSVQIAAMATNTGGAAPMVDLTLTEVSYL